MGKTYSHLSHYERNLIQVSLEQAHLMRDLAKSLDRLGHSLTIFEAMMSELPIIVTNAGGTPEIMTHQEDVLLCFPEKLGDISKSLKKLSNFRLEACM